jgi:transcriptional regulator with XRE-family HTH domain
MDIQSAISRHGTTKAELARKMEVAPSYITQLVSGQSSPSMKMLDKLADLIGCKRWEFFIDEMDREEVAQLFGLIVPPQEEPADEPEQHQEQAEEQQQTAADAQEGAAQEGQQQEQDAEKQEESLQTELVGLVRCPQCGHSIRLFAEE